MRGELYAHFGNSVFGQGEIVDRKAIAERVFADAEELRWLESLLHPRVRGAWTRLVEQDPAAEWLVEIPLLFEKRLESLFDLTVCIASPRPVARCRMAARGYSGKQFDQRCHRQMPLEDKVRRADHVILNAGSLDFLKRQTLQLITLVRDYQ